MEIDDCSVVDLATLKEADSLYPYNHRYLVEGFNYPAAYPTNEEQIYTGFDIVAEYLMMEVSVLDMVNTVASDDYEKYALDYDMPDSGATITPSITKDAMKCFLVKVDGENTDFTNEKFLLKLDAKDTLYKYIRLKAVLKTTDTSLTPVLDSYRIKVTNN